MPLWVWLLLAVFLISCAGTDSTHHLWVGQRPFSHEIARSTGETVPSLVRGVERACELLGAGSPPSSEVVIHLAAGRHQLLQPLGFTACHSRISFVGHGDRAQPSIISGGIVVAGDTATGGTNGSGWAVVGPAYCKGCTELWRAATPKGLDSRQFYVNGVRANRTWAPFQQSMEDGTARGTTSGDPTSDKILLPGHETMLGWTHNTSAIELVYRGAYSAGSQWSESRCPVKSIAKTPAPMYHDPGFGGAGAEGDGAMCCASHCNLPNCPICCGAVGSVAKDHTVACNVSTTKQCPVVCPQTVPFCVDYVVNEHWGHCVKSLPPIQGVEVTVAQPCVGNGNVKCGGAQALKVPAYVENVFELLGSDKFGHPGDFYLDASAGFVYYVPNAGESMNTTQGVLPAVEALIVADQVEGQAYTNIVFEHATWMQPSTTAGFVEVQSGYCLTCPNETVDHCRDCSLAVHHDPTPAAVQFQRSSNITFTGCTFRHIGSNGVSFSHGSQNNTVSRCLFWDLSASAVAVGNRTVPLRPNHSDWDYGNEVSDCTIRRVAQEYRGAPAILIGLTHSTRVLHNEIALVPYSGISLGWGWDSFPYTFGGANRIEANHIHHHMQILGDGGAIYTLGVQGNRPFKVDANGKRYTNKTAVLAPSTMLRNYVHDAPQPGDEAAAVLDHDGIGAGCHCPAGLYTDEGSTNWNISDNVIAQVESWLNGCRDGCPWIGPNWQDNNWYDAASAHVANNETRCPTSGNIEVNASVWPKSAAQIIARAGPRAVISSPSRN